MEAVKTQESPRAPPLDPSLAPVLLFNCGRGGGDPEEGDSGGGSRLVYSIPKRQLLLAGDSSRLVDNVNWITAQGWMLTLDPATRSTSLRDPFTSCTISLPPDRESLLVGSDDTRCVMSTRRPTDSGCVVVVTHVTEPVLCYCRPGSSRWFRHQYRPELLVTDDRFGRDDIIDEVARHTAAASGRFYTYWDDKLATLEFSPDPTLLPPVSWVYWDPTYWDDKLPPACYHSERCLVESCGDLFMVLFCGTSVAGNLQTLAVEVQKLEWSRSAWVKVTALGSSRVFFIGDQFGASLPADEFGLKENCIYFWYDGDKGLYVYDMEQGTTAMHNPGPEIPDSLEPIVLLMPAT